MRDRLFDATVCERCRKELGPARMMSWFTEQTICMECADKERDLKRALRAAGLSDHEGCGYVPQDPRKGEVKP